MVVIDDNHQRAKKRLACFGWSDAWHKKHGIKKCPCGYPHRRKRIKGDSK
jgi:hypothetical protein